MRIMFICGSLEPGRDGVGDYTRRLGEELHLMGHDISIIGYNDIFQQQVTDSNHYEIKNGVRICRIPATTYLVDRIKICQEFIKKENPDTISLQFVPYSFNPRGLPFGLASQLKRIAGDRLWHIMFHELWVGIDLKKPIRSWVISKLQRRIIRQFKILNSRVVHTQLPLYFDNLNKIGFAVKPLPLFSNVKKFNSNSNSSSAEVFRIGIFSQIAVVPEVIEFIKAYAAQFAQRNTLIEVFLIGDNGSLRAFSRHLETLDIPNCKILNSGFLDFRMASEAIDSCNIGLTSVPRHALGKSGSVTAFLSHDKPIAAPVIGKKIKPFEIGFLSDSLKRGIITDLSAESFRAVQSNIAGIGLEIDVQAIARTFINDLQGSMSTTGTCTVNHGMDIVHG